MGQYVFRLPDIGEGIAQAEIVAWHVAVGDRIAEDGLLADMMTDKATVEMESPVTGIVKELAGQVGDMVAIGSSLVVIETDMEDHEEPAATAIQQVAAPSFPVPPASDTQVRELGEPAEEGGGVAHATMYAPIRSRQLAAPAVRARARSQGIALADVPTGPEGLITHAELDAFLINRASTGRKSKLPERKAAGEPQISGAGEEIKVIGLRRRIAENMAAAKRHIPHFSYVEECDVTALDALRAELNALGGDRPKLTLLPFLVAAICRCLPEFPMMNARYDDEAGMVTRYASVHMGIATQTDAGLMVPVVRDAQAMPLWRIASEIGRLATAARDGSATPGELSGSTLTITSLGTLGGIATTPVINRPEVAIIGPNRIVERPVFVPDGAGGERLEKRKLMNISVSCDHRVIDGWDAASFVRALKARLETPQTILV